MVALRGDHKNKIPAVRPRSLDTNPLPLNTAGILFPGKCLSARLAQLQAFIAIRIDEMQYLGSQG